MVSVISPNNRRILLDRKEILRYLGYGGASPKENDAALIERCTDEVATAIDCKACYDCFSVTVSGDSVSVGPITVTSKALKRNLNGCQSAVIFTATVGFQVDRIISRYSLLSPSHAVVAQAAGAAAIEAWCDEICRILAEQYSDKHLRPRFSPGYGDVPLAVQNDIFALLDCRRKIGVTLTENLLMLPSKSVSAIVGIGASKGIECDNSCEMCDNTECEFRR